MKITDTIKYVGVNDHQVDLFEGQYAVPNGMAYNSYVILDEKVAVMDTVDANFKHEWLDNLEQVLAGRKPDYLIVQHMEPDHAANVANFLEVYPGTTVVANAKTFVMIKNFFGLDLEGQKLEVENGSTLSLGNHNLTFVFAPMVHWPEVMVTYDSTDKVLFSADGFGKFGALDADEDWACEARRYYFNIVGKYGMGVMLPYMKTIAACYITCALFTVFVQGGLMAGLYGGISPIRFFSVMKEAMLFVFATCSSVATIPLNLKCTKELGVSDKIADFVIPFGAVMNMNGTAIYEAVAVIFASQVFGIQLTLTQQIMVMVTAVLASVGTAGIPGSGLVMLTIVLNAVHLPLETIGLLAGIDRILNMARVIPNIVGDAAAAVVVAKSEGELNTVGLKK